MKNRIILQLVSVLVVILLLSFTSLAQTTEFTYQGYLNDSSQPANGNYDFEFALFDALLSGNQIGSTLTRTGVTVSEGKFDVKLDFGAEFPGAGRWLEIRVQQSTSSASKDLIPAFTTLSPRQPVTSAPYAVKSLNATNAATAANAIQLGGIDAGQFVLTSDPRMTDPRPPTTGSTYYIQNTTTLQTSSDFNISGTGDANIFNVATQYNIAGDRVLSVAGSENVFVGKGTGASNSGDQNVFIGSAAGFANTSGIRNSFIGNSAGNQNTTGSYNLFVGSQAGANNTTSGSNSFVGSSAGNQNTTGTANSFFGDRSGFSNTTGEFNVFVGAQAGRFNVIGAANSFFGDRAGYANLTGSNNTAVGYYADFNNPALSFATALGAGAVATSNNTIQLGRNTLDVVRIGKAGAAGATFVCLNASNAIATCSTGPATFTGPLTGDVTGTQGATVVSNVGGVTAGDVATGANLANAATDANTSSTIVRRDGSGNFSAGTINANGVALPTTSGSTVGVITQNGSRLIHTYGTYNFFAGQNAGNFTMTGFGNTATGRKSLYSNTTGEDNAASGYQALFSNTTGKYNTASGAFSLYSNGTGTFNTAFGNTALYGNTTGSKNIALGMGAGFNLTTGDNNIDIGNAGVAGESNIIRIGTSQTNTYLTGIIHGNGSGLGGVILNGTTLQPTSNFNISGTGNADNFNAGSGFRIRGQTVLSVDGISNTFVGRSVGASNTGTSNTFVGYFAGQNNTSGRGNSFFGRGAGASNTTTNDNSFFGYLSGASSAGGVRNSFFGMSAGYGNTTGDLNVFLGGNAGDANITGSSNTAVGYDANFASGGLQYATAVGAKAQAQTSNQVQLGRAWLDSVRIGVVLPYHLPSHPGPFCIGRAEPGLFQFMWCNPPLSMMEDIKSLTSSLEIIDGLRPITFSSRGNGYRELGLVPKDNTPTKSFLFHLNKEGETDGLKYDKIGVVLVSAMQEQQSLIEDQQTQIAEQNELIKKQQTELDALKAFICSQNPTASICAGKEKKTVRKIKNLFLSIAVISLFGGFLYSQSGGSFEIKKSVIAGGGGEATGGSFNVKGTIGQPLATTSTGGNFEVKSGFWVGGESTTSPGNTKFDFEGDGKADVSVFRPGPGEWWYQRSSDTLVTALQFGSVTDIPVPADYTGDGATDIAFFRPATGQWFVLRSEDSSFFAFNFGSNGDQPAPGDFDGDGIDDPAVFRESIGQWFILRSSDGGSTNVPFGIPGDKALVGDYDGDGTDDVGVFRSSLSQYWLLRSTAGLIAYQFGASGDQAFAADFTGDGTDDAGFFRPATGQWFILRSDDQSFFAFPFGATGDIPAPADYDGDGTADPTVFRPTTTTWFSAQTTSGTVITPFGANGDRPAANSYVVN